MAYVIATPAAAPMDPPNRRLAWGLLVSLLLHALLLSLKFGIPGLRPGPGGPVIMHLAPLPANPAPATVPEPLPAIPSVSPAPALPLSPAPLPLPQALPQEQARPAPPAQQGFTLLDPPRPKPAPPPPVIQPPRAPRRRTRARPHATHDGLHTQVIAEDVRKDDSFVVPPAARAPAPDANPDASASARTADAQASPDAPETAQAKPVDAPAAEPEQAALAGPTEEEQDEERARLAAQREQARAARREAEEQALQAAAAADARRAADQQARELSQQGARYEDELASRQRQADEAQRRADEAQRQAAARAQAEQQRIQAEQEKAQQLAEQQRIQAEQARAQQLAEQQRIQAEQAKAQQLVEQQRIQAEQARAQQLADLQRARQLAEQREADERQRQAQARQQAEQLARDQAEQAGRLARQDQRRGGAPGNSGLDGLGGDTGALPRSALESPLASRARELLRGIDLDKPVPQAMQAAEDARRTLRRPLADAMLHDVPLRMYVDSIRQKIEHNAIVSPSQLAQDAVRIFPIVSITLRSDGSIDDVTIIRSSGRADIDEIVRRVVHLNARYAAFPPNVAAHYDVIELRRVWSFSGVLRLLEEMR